MGGGRCPFDFVVCGCVVVCGERESGGGDDCVFEVDVCVKKKRGGNGNGERGTLVFGDVFCGNGVPGRGGRVPRRRPPPLFELFCRLLRFE